MVTLGIITGVLLGVFLADQRRGSWPPLVVLLNGFAGGAAALLSAALLAEPGLASTDRLAQVATLCASTSAGWLGAFACGGSIAAAARFQNPHGGCSTGFPGQSLLNIVLVLLSFAIGAWVIARPPAHAAFWGMSATAACSGLLLVTSTRSDDLPILTPWFNACAGMATAAVGVVLGNFIPMIAGTFVASAGLILTYRLLRQEARGSGSSQEVECFGAPIARTTSVAETAGWLKSARRVVVVPGFGMIASHAEEAVRDLVLQLRGQGIEVDVAVHPGGGRVPGQLLEELINAGLPSELCEEPDEANLLLSQTDVALAIGAGDVVNLAASDAPESPLSGGPIIDVRRARRVVLLKRSTQPGFAGIPNALFSADNVSWLPTDARSGTLEILNALTKPALA